MKILLFGKNGQIGWELNRSLQPLGGVVALGRDDVDFSNSESLREVIKSVKPDVIVNAVAYTSVDRAEEEEGIATAVNATSVGVLAEEALKVNALLIHYSTDYVFDGEKSSPYVETDKPNPINAYGRTKLAGELVIELSGCDYLIFRTSWVYASRGNNFLLTIFKLAKERKKLNIVSDQIGSPTSARLIAETTMLCMQQSVKERNRGIFFSSLYHLAASSSTSWHGFSQEIVGMAKKKVKLALEVENIKAISTAEYPMSAQRPLNSQLIFTKIEKKFGIVMSDWKLSLALCLEELIN